MKRGRGALCALLLLALLFDVVATPSRTASLVSRILAESPATAEYIQVKETPTLVSDVSVCATFSRELGDFEATTDEGESVTAASMERDMSAEKQTPNLSLIPALATPQRIVSMLRLTILTPDSDDRLPCQHVRPRPRVDKAQRRLSPATPCSCRGSIRRRSAAQRAFYVTAAPLAPDTTPTTVL